MQRFSSVLYSLLLVAVLGLVVAGCDESPTSVEDFDIQPGLSLSNSQVTFVAGQATPPQVEATYQGLDTAPTIESSAPELAIELVEENGTPEDGSRTWTLVYTDFVEGSSVSESATLTAQADGSTIESTVSVQVNNPISLTTDFEPRFLVVEDYETGFQDGPENGAGILPEITTEGTTTAEIQSEEVSPNSNGPNALLVNASAEEAVTFVRQTNAPGLSVLSFLLKPDPSEDFLLTIELEEEANGDLVAREIEVPIEAGDEWVRYDLAVGALFDDFNPVAISAGGNGPLESISFRTDSDATYYVDEIMMGTTAGPQLEINDFQATSFAYGTFAEIELGSSDQVAANASGFTARSMSYVSGGNFFGYNYNLPRLANGGSGDVVVRIGQVSRSFDLFVFIETPETDDGRAGGFSFNAGETVSVDEGDEWREVRMPISQLGDEPSALVDPGITNVGFEIRRPDGDSTEEPIEFLIDEIRLDATGN